MLPPALVPVWAREQQFGSGYVCTFPDMVAIDSQGRVAPCDKLLNSKSQLLGDLSVSSLKALYMSDSAAWWRDLSKEPTKNLKGLCRRCCFLNLCCGGCRTLSYVKHGHWNAPDIWCEEAYRCGLFPDYYLHPE